MTSRGNEGSSERTAVSCSRLGDFDWMFAPSMYEDWTKNFGACIQPDASPVRDGVLTFSSSELYSASRSQTTEKPEKLQDGKLVELSDKRGYTERGNEREYYGPNPGEKFTIRTNADGSFTVLDEGKNEIKQSTDAATVKARQEVLKLAETKITDPFELARFKADVARFEARAQKSGIDAANVAESYKQLGRILEATGNKPLSERERTMLAGQVMAQLANPQSIDQGAYSTCNVTTVETLVYSRNPEKAAQLIADIATTGSYMAGGSYVKLNKASLRPQGKAANWPQEADGDRTYATQLFNVTATNLYYAKYDRKFRYEQAAEKKNRQGEVKDNGEHLINRRTGKVVETSPNLNDSQIARVHNMIVGGTDNRFYLGHSTYTDNTGNRTTTFSTELEFRKQLEDAKREGRFPLILKVDTTNEPWYTDTDSETDEAGGAHVVTITGYEPGPPAMVRVDNQWGDDLDHNDEDTSVPLRELYLSSMDAPTAARQLRQEMKAQQNSLGYAELSTELEALRLERSARQIGEEVYGQKVLDAIEKAEARWATNPAKYQRENEESVSRIKSIAGSLRPEERANLVMHLAKSGTLSAEDFDAMLADGIVYAIVRKEAKQEKKLFGPRNSREHEAAMKKYADELAKLPEERQVEMFKDYSDKWLQKVFDNLPPDERARLKAVLKRP